jgi:hypothetical protein
MRVWGQRLLLAVAVALLPYFLASARPGTHAPASYEGVDPLLQSAVLLYSADELPLSMDRWDAPFFHPSALSLSFMDPLLGQAASVRWIPGIQGSPGWLYFAAFALTLGLAFLATLQLGRALGLREWQAIVAGLAFTLCPYAAAHWHHLNALLGLLRMYRAERRGAALLLVALCAQLSYGIYGLASQLLLVLPLSLLVVSKSSRTTRLRLLFVGVSFASVLWLFSAPYRLATEQVDGFDRAVAESGPYAARVFDLWHGPSAHLLPWPEWIPGRGVIYPGWGIVFLAAAALWCGRRRGVDRGGMMTALAAALFGVLLAFGRSAPFPFLANEPSLPFAWLQDLLWPLRAIRAPYRFFQPITLALALLAPVGAAMLWRLAPPKARALLLLLFLGAALDAAPGGLDRVRLGFDAGERELIAGLAAQADSPWTIVPQPCGENSETPEHARAMQWAVASGAPFVGGSSGFVPASHVALRSRCCGGANLGCLDALAELGVRLLLSRQELGDMEGLSAGMRLGEYWVYELAP